MKPIPIPTDVVDRMEESRIELNKKLNILNAHKQTLEAKLNSNGISDDQWKCWKYQLGCLERPISRVMAQLNELQL